ncbi:MAG: hypothetical protein GY820_25750, partial [Gammaproteobacteria bacterium]|nr:hypothetical protein [Gammaproteobacteria bacterium]
MCKAQVGIRKAIECTADCGRFRHRRCLEIANKAVSQCLSCTAVTQLASSADKSYIETLLASAGLEEEEETDNLSVHSEGEIVSRLESNEVSDVEESGIVIYTVQGDEVWQLEAGISTKVVDINIIKRIMDQTMVKGLLDAFMDQLKVDNQIKEDAAKVERDAAKADREAEKAERDSEILKQREERIRDKQELRDYVKNFVGQFVDTGDHATQGNNNPLVSASIPNQSQGALGMGP